MIRKPKSLNSNFTSIFLTVFGFNSKLKYFILKHIKIII